MLFTTKWLANIFTHYDGKLKLDDQIDYVFIDSRERIKNSLFVPIVGERFDGHDFVEQAIEHGAIAILWEESKPLPEKIPHDVVVFFVQDTTKALQQLAHEYKNAVHPKVVGITGSNGKTTTKDLVATVVKSTYKTHFTDGNFNNHIGLPLTILSMPNNTEVLVLEMGMSDFGEIDLLSRIAEPDYSIITNIGESHIEFLGSRKGIVEAKLEIRNGMASDGKLIIDGDEPELEDLYHEKNIITCGFNDTNHVMINNVCISGTTTKFQINDGIMYEIPLLGKHHAKNASYAITLGEQLNIDQKLIKKSLEKLEITSMRFEFIKGKNHATIINDAYNASPTSMVGAIDVIKSLDEYPNKVLVLGDIFELGQQSKQFHQSIGEAICSPISTVLTYGEAAEEITKTVKEKQPNIKSQHFTSKEQLVSTLESYLNSETVILFKASRGMEFENFVNQIKE